MATVRRRVLVVVTGLPGSGKTTLARSLAVTTHLPLLSLDVVKESLHDSLRLADRAQLRAASLDVIWSVLPDFPQGAVVELWVDPARDQETLRRDLARFEASPIVEVMCVVPGDEAARRYADRPRHYGGHLPADHAMLDRIRRSAALLQPLGVGPVLRVDTTRAVDLDAIVGWLRHQVDRGAPQAT